MAVPPAPKNSRMGLRCAAGLADRQPGLACTIARNKTRQGYACKRTLKPAGYFLGGQ